VRLDPTPPEVGQGEQQHVTALAGPGQHLTVNTALTFVALSSSGVRASSLAVPTSPSSPTPANSPPAANRPSGDSAIAVTFSVRPGKRATSAPWRGRRPRRCRRRRH
jgi:hypothetical protein